MGTGAGDLWAEAPVASDDGEILHVDVDGYEGPLDLLLELARKQKVDLAAISVLSLAEQYLGFIDQARTQRIEVAADYLVMAAWLTYLKSRLMVPRDAGGEEPSGEEMAAMLQFRLQRLEAMRDAARRLINASRLGRDVFARGMPEATILNRHRQWQADYSDLLGAYAARRQQGVHTEYAPEPRTVWSLADAEQILVRLIGDQAEWVPIQALLAGYVSAPEERQSALASSFTASLELARRGDVELRQHDVFGPLFVRRREKSDGGKR
ncbi:MAG: segregation/condensation protein A [Alphaproteobacteria bacterium]|nr:segregation/condensation protein A [Alphaproteobacteria bacterium]